ncbi:peptidylprolyl isomerase [Neptunicella sp. SCSIO 80796]|uniref:peptidylprolyl isomerase n=1 Tax=Neptunicella plasticusilytica TaxID=3117012 RepID=UPI003A4D240D
MHQITKLKFASIALMIGLTSFTSSATVVEVQTSMGSFQVNLFDNATPKTVENFLAYVNSGEYFHTVVHRSMPDFVVQSGGFKFEDDFPITEVVTSAAVANEPELSNVRGTLAMAKLGGKPNSATSQWFVNLDDNSANLDVQNGGFTVFGQVLGDGMDVVDAIAALPRFNLGDAFDNMPLRDFTEEDADNGVALTEQNLVMINDIVVIDADVTTHPEITPTPNTLIDSVDNSSGSSGGGSFGWLVLVLGLSVGYRLKR